MCLPKTDWDLEACGRIPQAALLIVLASRDTVPTENPNAHPSCQLRPACPRLSRSSFSPSRTRIGEQPVPATSILRAILAFVHALFRSRLSLQIEILALRHQLAVYQRTDARPCLKPADRLLWAWLSRVWADWQGALVFVKPETVIAWKRRRFGEYWRRLSRSGEPGRPSIPREVRDPIRRRRPPSATWRAFLKNHVRDIVATDSFVVPTVRNQVLFVFLILAHERRRVLHFNVTAFPTSERTAQQVVAADRLHPARVPGSHDRAWRAAPKARADQLLRLLPPLADASVTGDG